MDGALALGDVGGGGLLVVELVQHALAAGAEPGERDLAGDHDHRDAGRVGLLEARKAGQRPGSGGEEKDPDLVRGARYPSAENAALFSTREETNRSRGARERVEQSQRMLAGDAENRLRAERGEGFDDQVPAVASVGRAVPPAASGPGDDAGASAGVSVVAFVSTRRPSAVR